MPSSGSSLGPAELCELGNQFSRSGNFEQAVAAYYRCLKLAPGSAVAAIGLAGASRALGKLDIAVKVLETALRFNPQDARVLNTLGVACLEAGDPRRAVEILERVLAGDSRNFDAAFNLGNTHRTLGDRERALAFYRQAAEIRPADADAQTSAGDMLLARGRIAEAARHYENAHRAGDPDALYNLGVALLYGDDREAAKSAFERASGRGESFTGLASSVFLALLVFVEGDEERSLQILRRASALLSLEEAGPRRADIRNMKVYCEYLHALMNSLPEARAATGLAGPDRLHVIGDSHVLSMSGATLSCEGTPLRTAVHWILGCKQFHLGRDSDNQYRRKFASIAAAIPANAAVLLSLGEIDCRLGGGIFEAWKKKGAGRSVEEVVLDTVRPYIDTVARSLAGRRIILCGVPAAQRTNLQSLPPDEKRLYTGMVRHFNETQRELGRAAGMGFLDLHGLTDAGEGMANGYWHIDAVHLRLEAYVEAFRHRLVPAGG